MGEGPCPSQDHTRSWQVRPQGEGGPFRILSHAEKCFPKVGLSSPQPCHPVSVPKTPVFNSKSLCLYLMFSSLPQGRPFYTN